MNDCKVLLDKLNNAIKTIENMVVYDLILSIETAYQLNKELLAFDYKYNDSNDDKMSFYNTLQIFPVNEEGFEDFSISRQSLHFIGDFSLTLYNKQILPDKLNKQKICQQILNDFKYIQSAEDRFSIYQKHTFGLIPGINLVINEFKEPNFIINNFNSPLKWEDITYNNRIISDSITLPKSLNAFKDGIRKGYNFYMYLDNLYTKFNKFKSFIYIEELVNLLQTDPAIKEINIHLKPSDHYLYSNAVLFAQFILDPHANQNNFYHSYETRTPYNHFNLQNKFTDIYKNGKTSFSIQQDSDLKEILLLLSYFDISNKDAEALLASHDKHLISKHITDTVIKNKPVKRL